MMNKSIIHARKIDLISRSPCETAGLKINNEHENENVYDHSNKYYGKTKNEKENNIITMART